MLMFLNFMMSGPFNSRVFGVLCRSYFSDSGSVLSFFDIFFLDFLCSLWNSC